MRVELIKKYIRCGLYNEARKLIESVDDMDSLMEEDQMSTMDRRDTVSLETNDKKLNSLPLLILLAFLRNEDDAINLSRLLLERGYYLDINDQNGLCALNYAIALRRVKLVNLFLDSFNFELNTYRDCFKNTFLHYIYAVNHSKITERFENIYSKFYNWDVSKFKDMKNCDGLSVQDLYDYSQMLEKEMELKRRRPQTASTLREERYKRNHPIPDLIRFDSSPVSICNFINNIYNSNSTIKSELIFVLNSAKNLAHLHREGITT